MLDGGSNAVTRAQNERFDDALDMILEDVATKNEMGIGKTLQLLCDLSRTNRSELTDLLHIHITTDLSKNPAE